MIVVWEVAVYYIFWILKGGNCHFWYDNWMGSGAIASKVEGVFTHCVRDFIDQGVWNQDLLRQCLPD